MFYLRFVSHLLSISIFYLVAAAITAILHRFITQFPFVITFSVMLIIAISCNNYWTCDSFIHPFVHLFKFIMQAMLHALYAHTIKIIFILLFVLLV